MSATGPPITETGAAKWQGLEVRHLLALVAVAEETSFSRAAERLGYTQSAISQQIGALERIVGTPLFDRPGGPRKVRLTEAGTALRRHAQAVLSRVGAAEADLRDLASGEGGALRVGTIQSVGTKVMPLALRRFAADWPGISVTLVQSADCRELLERVEAGELDLAFASTPVPPGPFVVRHVLEDPFVFVTAAGSPLAASTGISVEEVATVPLIGFGNDQCQVDVVATFDGYDVRPDFVFQLDDNGTIQRCIAEGLASGILPLLTVDLPDPAVAVVPLDPPVPPRRLVLAWHEARRQSPAAAAFVEVAAAVCAELDGRTPAQMLSGSPPRASAQPQAAARQSLKAASSTAQTTDVGGPVAPARRSA